MRYLQLNRKLALYAYLARNKLWIKPALVGMMLAVAASTVRMIEQKTGAAPAAQWAAPLGIGIASFGAGLGAMFTDTISAYIIRFIGIAAGMAAFLHTLISSLG